MLKQQMNDNKEDQISLSLTLKDINIAKSTKKNCKGKNNSNCNESIKSIFLNAQKRMLKKIEMKIEQQQTKVQKLQHGKWKDASHIQKITLQIKMKKIYNLDKEKRRLKTSAHYAVLCHYLQENQLKAKLLEIQTKCYSVETRHNE